MNRKRGPGRPPIDPDGDTYSARVRIGPTHRRLLEQLIADGEAKTLSGAVRYLIEESARRRKAK